MANDLARWNEIADAEQCERMAKLLRKLPFSFASELARTQSEPALNAMERAASLFDQLAKELREHGRKTAG